MSMNVLRTEDMIGRVSGAGLPKGMVSGEVTYLQSASKFKSNARIAGGPDFLQGRQLLEQSKSQASAVQSVAEHAERSDGTAGFGAETTPAHLTRKIVPLERRGTGQEQVGASDVFMIGQATPHLDGERSLELADDLEDDEVIVLEADNQDVFDADIV